MIPGFSIVICTYNGQNRLQPTLSHLAALNIPADHTVELIVVDNASTDNTADFVKETWLTLGTPFSLRVISEPRAGKGYAVETGYDAARYSYILTVDDDNLLASNYLVNALEVFGKDSDIGILQGQSTGVFEVPPPSWAEEMMGCFIIGSPIPNPGYFPDGSSDVWGAGMIIKKEDWCYLREKGFSFLTSKIPGKAAGEDNETAIGLLLLGRKIYYSDKLQYKHFMPAGRVNWNKLRVTFQTSGYTNHYFFLYDLVADAYEKGYMITNSLVRKKFRKHYLRKLKSFTLKQHLAYWLKPQHEFYQLRLAYCYSLGKWFLKLHGRALKDIAFLQSWMHPLLNSKGSNIVDKRNIDSVEHA